MDLMLASSILQSKHSDNHLFAHSYFHRSVEPVILKEKASFPPQVHASREVFDFSSTYSGFFSQSI